MSADEKKQSARRLLGLSEQMLRAARQGEWASVAELEAQRRDLSQQLFADPVPAEAADVVNHCVRELLALDPELIQLAEAARDEAGEAVRRTQTGKTALSAYRRYSR
ncbi:flagellar protein FliT [Aquisalimonas sp. APHAB1-3]|uniref:flagellar protein FliT n=3 Tax=unclassified Aquisalimonas TaxID=2644645 RepID=UPI003AAA56F3